GSPFGHWMLARALDACDQFHEALVESEKAASLSGDSQPYAAHLGYAHARNGDRTKARRVLARLAELSKQQYVSPYDFAVVYAALGDKDSAFRWLEKAFKTLRPDRRFRALAGRVGLPEDMSGDN